MMKHEAAAFGRAVYHVKPRPDFDITLDRAGVSKAALARVAGKSAQTIHAMLNPALQSTQRSGVRRSTAEDLAKAFADLTGCSEDEALRRLFVIS